MVTLARSLVSGCGGTPTQAGLSDLRTHDGDGLRVAGRTDQAVTRGWFNRHGSVRELVTSVLDSDEGSSACACRPARRIPDHSLEGRVEARSVVVRAEVTPPDPLVDALAGKRGLPGGSEGTGCLQYQLPVRNALGHVRTDSARSSANWQLALISRNIACTASGYRRLRRPPIPLGRLEPRSRP